MRLAAGPVAIDRATRRVTVHGWGILNVWGDQDIGLGQRGYAICVPTQCPNNPKKVAAR
jgi:hypothetical protein